MYISDKNRNKRLGRDGKQMQSKRKQGDQYDIKKWNIRLKVFVKIERKNV